MAATILVVEDEPAIQELISYNLELAGHQALRAENAEQALDMVRDALPDLVVLDWMLPGMSGIELARRLRSDKRTQGVPLIMLTARADERDKLQGLETGADDYLTKPFAFAELLARLRALARRGAEERPTLLRAGDLELDPAARRVRRADTDIALTAKEFALLEYMLRHAGEVLTRTQIIDHVWDFAYAGTSNVVDVYVRYLRDKIDRPFDTTTIETVRGVGYRIRED
jgi:phosphate regulon transcriptional regulator PhoB